VVCGDARFAKSGNMVTDTKNMAQALSSRDYPSLHMQMEVLNDETHVSVAPRGFTHGLKFLLPAADLPRIDKPRDNENAVARQ
jgi:hypothetical protein